jgi:hypothetical protein
VFADLVKLKQYPGKTVKQYLDRFMQPRGKRWYRIPKKIFVIIAQQGLKWDSERN